MMSAGSSAPAENAHNTAQKVIQSRRIVEEKGFKIKMILKLILKISWKYLILNIYIIAKCLYLFTEAPKISGKLENITVNGCNKTIEQDFYFSIGNCCNNFGGGNLFPFEYRTWSSIATAKVVIPPYYTINSIDLKRPMSHVRKNVYKA